MTGPVLIDKGPLLDGEGHDVCPATASTAYQRLVVVRGRAHWAPSMSPGLYLDVTVLYSILSGARVHGRRHGAIS
jgi:hypothetical protein